jgi:hypothetical protein
MALRGLVSAEAATGQLQSDTQVLAAGLIWLAAMEVARLGSIAVLCGHQAPLITLLKPVGCPCS